MCERSWIGRLDLLSPLCGKGSIFLCKANLMPNTKRLNKLYAQTSACVQIRCAGMQSCKQRSRRTQPSLVRGVEWDRLIPSAHVDIRTSFGRHGMEMRPLRAFLRQSRLTKREPEPQLFRKKNDVPIKKVRNGLFRPRLPTFLVAERLLALELYSSAAAAGTNIF